MRHIESAVEELRQKGLSCLRANAVEEALSHFNQALNEATDPETIELLKINKSRALIAMTMSGPEVQLLPQIIMRRGNLRHVYLAAYNLQYKFRLENELTRARMYGRIALEAADEAGELDWKHPVLLELGNICLLDSHNAEAVKFYEDVLALLGEVPQHRLSRAFAYQNLGYCLLVENRTDEGLRLIHDAISLMEQAGAEGFLAESYIDLCLGYLDKEQLDFAGHYGEIGLSMATEDRQIRNAHYLLGEVAYKSGDQATAERHFSHLASYYPDFPHLKDFLLAIDLRGMVNLKL